MVFEKKEKKRFSRYDSKGQKDFQDFFSHLRNYSLDTLAVFTIILHNYCYSFCTFFDFFLSSPSLVALICFTSLSEFSSLRHRFHIAPSSLSFSYPFTLVYTHIQSIFHFFSLFLNPYTALPPFSPPTPPFSLSRSRKKSTFFFPLFCSLGDQFFFILTVITSTDPSYSTTYFPKSHCFRFYIDFF